MTVTLYGSMMSLYTGRVRSYLTKAGVPFQELPPVSDHYEDVVLPLAGERRSMPTVELTDGTVIRDSVAIVDHFEAQSGSPFSPTTPKQRAISLLFDVIGAEGLMRPAMHYRWRFPENEPLVRLHFEAITPRNAPWQFTVAGRFERMQQACSDLGAPPERVELVETLYEGLLQKLDAHFSAFPYLLGGKPSIGDFGLIAPMYAHLGRDLKPLSLMHKHGLHVLCWVERMNRAGTDFGAGHAQTHTFIDDDAIPESLLDVLRHLAIDFVPETQAACATTNQWLAEQDELPPGTAVERAVGMCTFAVQGANMTAAAQPFRLYLLKRLQDAVAQETDADRAAIVAMLKAANMDSLLTLQLNRQIGRAGNLEVWQ